MSKHLLWGLCINLCIWLAAGIDLATVRAWAGHADLTTTSRYTHWLGTNADHASINKLNQAIQTPTTQAEIHTLTQNGGTPGVRAENLATGTK